jgi:hypothetical protein
MDEAADQLISPELAIESDGMNMVISWPANFTGYQVYWAPTATDRNWEIVTNAVVVANGLNQIVVPASGSGRFFRLQK